ncbi:hypothetical protein K493DRAFT_378351 [Basidiobolus meristosporus CBS 931.73]|uniref:DUF803-domain-containing protein n=1 Tax=Basidiobolus meristosporus CBS 931.73 TaxID=1314790 RepID=A0A1Y1Y105_9FUNG|nr:hypothetical protein K493DRAFT_378351 [Basidiobolus meristosporus CBS 931.73]|eukprot:ORX91639.1 hypothetical protein K493DRAFT_378351 [Basidiobolus meristosporus CBS 931.73]
MPDSTALNYIIGFAVSLCASIIDAFGTNLMKRDHSRNAALPPEQRKHEFLRWGWLLGLFCYVGSQVIGSTIALNFLRTQWVAPLGSIALIFNFIFARLLVGTPITRNDLYGTAIVICSVVWVVVFGGLRNGDDCITIGAFVFAIITKRRLSKKQENWLVKPSEEIRLHRLVGISFACIGGLFASETLLLAKSGIRLLVISLSTKNQFTDALSICIVIGLIFTAVIQLYCLNSALKFANSVVVIPLFYCFYTCVGLLNTCVYLDQFETYPWWVLLLVLLGVIALVFGVRLLSKSRDDDQAYMSVPDAEQNTFAMTQCTD